jgi:cobalamin biosynthesis protein CobT
MRKSKDLIGSLPIVAKALGDKYGVEVRIGGDKACTDGKVIHLPSLPPDDESVAILARGYLDHEAAHVRFTEGGLSGSPLEMALQNILEDVRIEKQMGERYPGCKTNLRNLVTKLVSDGVFKGSEEGAHPGVVLQAYLLHRLRATVLKQEALNDLASQAEARLKETFPEGAATRIAALGWQVEDCQSTSDVRALAKRIIKAVEEEEEKEKQEQEQQQEQQQKQEQGGASDQPEQSEIGDQDGEGNGSGDDSPQGDSGGQAPAGGDKADSAEQKGPSAMRQALDATPEDLLEDAFKQVAEKLEGESTNAPAVEVSEDLSEGTGTAPLTYGEKPDETEARRTTNALRARLEGLIQATTFTRPRAARTGVRIDNRLIHRLAVSDTRIFKRRVEKVAVNTAVYILVDRSGSMASQMGLANLAVYSVSLALEGISGVALQTAVFPVEGHHVATLTRFGERVKASAYAVSAGGGTPMVEAMWRAGLELVRRQENRKILLVVTDGQISHQRDGLVDVIGRMEASGLEVMSLGIGRQCNADQFFPVSASISDTKQLAGALFSMLQKQLLGAAA